MHFISYLGAKPRSLSHVSADLMQTQSGIPMPPEIIAKEAADCLVESPLVAVSGHCERIRCLSDHREAT